jgi:hypothetical protein
LERGIVMPEVVMPEIVLRTRYCRACGAVFCVCRHCDRGQCYCCQVCRREARQQQLRAARHRYQQTEAGRWAHQMRQCRYRIRRSNASVTDHGSHPITTPRCANSSDLGNCAVCGRYSRWIDPFLAIPPRWSPTRRRRAVGRCSKNYVFR